MKKVMNSKVAAQKWLWWSDNGKIFNNNKSGEFWWRFPVGGGSTNSPELLLKNFAIIRPPQPLLGHCLWFHNFFHVAFFAWAAPFFTVWLFLYRLLLTRIKCLFSPSNDCNHNSMMTKIVKHYPFHPVLLGPFLASFMICTVLPDAARN